MKRSYGRWAAFTLIEVLLVIGILLVLGTVSVVAYTQVKASADKNTARLLVNSTVNAVKQYQVAMGKFPDSEQGLKALTTKPEDPKEAEKWRLFLEDGKIPVDSWGNELKYEYVGPNTSNAGAPEFHVWSLGPDGRDGSEDDIRSWTETVQ
jgi:general secretion pathway protein G